ncbi:YisL family protein [Bacillus cereus group sp. TH172LC]|uniref:YisL family protein n=1 Tax=Bacillus cereus group sp. TH172LC TaxID=3018056 RepID=UPI0022E1BDCA|nr:YisL family protein [Bacillus cereus group sp. TH172LC]MDA1627984.1 YisL family protein [Bacillus cereus group sp. TH172LC]
MVHMHITAWALGLILFFVAYSLYSAGRKGKGVHMGLRLMYIIIIVTGVWLYLDQTIVDKSYHMWYGLKMLAGILVISGMEMVLVKMSKNKATGAFWGLFIIALVAVFYLGLKLPIGWQVF